MPTYEYACSKCGHHFERFQSISAEPVKNCPKCNQTNVQRLIGGGNGFLFKGSGFYATDYRSSSYEKGKKADSTKTTSTSSTTTEKKKEKAWQAQNTWEYRGVDLSNCQRECLGLQEDPRGTEEVRH